MSQACRECGKVAKAAYCSTDCKTAFNRRRQMRGAILYDLVMANRYERDLATGLGIDRTFIARVGEHFRALDQQERNGRKSWGDARRVMEVNQAKINARLGHVSIGRKGG